MKLLLAIVSVGSLLILASCQKEAGFDTGGGSGSGGGGSVVNDSIYITKYVELDTTELPGLDTTYKYLFYYDNKKRLTKFTEYNFSTGTLTYDKIVYYSYYYNGNDTLPYKVSVEYADPSNVPYSWDTTFLQYDNAGYIKRDSSLQYLNQSGPPHLELTTYTALTPNRYKVIGTGTAMAVDSFIVDRTFVNGNTTQQVVHEYRGGINTSTYTTQETFDNHVNPFFRISIKAPVTTGFGFDSYFNDEPRNNVITESLNGASQGQQDWFYRSDGLPVIVHFFDPPNPALYIKGVYFYTKL